ncbi:hypothetical protein PVMG_05641 [Plasmodium vivax Mauritania I]|uniref:Uncharacterized protein n=1 Tax=Plasmodium vivax Mauritania I TaxID=1035515 RepID=A0A0J9TJP5_PLAVI|nr:hypothetical protein PVMG_05641 [Plasmodium vivax Mauritania I]
MERNSNSKLDETKLIIFYKAFFEEKCYDRHDYYFYCVSDEREKTLPSTLWELYKKFERNVKLIQEKTEIFSDWEKDKKKLCFYLKYWIYDQLIIKNVTNGEYSKFINLWNEQKESKCPRCECEFNISSFSNVKQLKRAYDYFLFLNAYNDTATISKHIADKYYCTYIGNTKAIYSSLESMCKDNPASHCTEFRDSDLPPIKEDDNSSILCNTELSPNPGLEEALKEAQALYQSLSVSILSRGNGDEVVGARGNGDELVGARENGDEEVGERKNDVGATRSQENDMARATQQVRLPLTPRLEDPTKFQALPNSLNEDNGIMVTTLSDSGSSGNGSPIKTITSASMVGIPSIIFLLYKVNKTYIFKY